MIKVKRVYDKPSREDGARILVDRLWPRGLSKEAAALDAWLKDVAPSDELRKWYGHDTSKWEEFKKRYASELAGKEDLLESLVDKARDGALTLLFGSREERYNNATAIKEMLETRLEEKGVSS
ncbi:MAG: DUF488 domain-containing protein [Actinomycetota bacterium]|nr:DUF488 domain-containing protein [Actinomycetota bacterium]MDD5667080.1 DUF488 domain-containing protein [Actinomycetota bacterium]